MQIVILYITKTNQNHRRLESSWKDLSFGSNLAILASLVQKWHKNDQKRCQNQFAILLKYEYFYELEDNFDKL